MEARLDQFDIDIQYMDYVTTSLRLAPQGEYITKGFLEIINSKKDNRSAEEIVVDIMTRAGLSFGE